MDSLGREQKSMPCNLGEFYTHYYISCVKRVSQRLTSLYKIDLETSTGGWGFPGGAVVKNPPANAGDARDTDVIPESERSPRVGNGNPFQYSCLENSTDTGGLQSMGLQRAELLNTHSGTVLQRVRAVSMTCPLPEEWP